MEPACDYDWKGRVTPKSEGTRYDRPEDDWFLDKNDVLISSRVVKQKRLTTEEWNNGCAIGFCEMGSLQDMDGDRIPGARMLVDRDESHYGVGPSRSPCASACSPLPPSSSSRR